MSLSNRYILLAAALAIVGIVITQVPMKSGIAQAQDGYPDKNGGLFSLKGGNGVVLGTILVGAGGAVATAGGAAAAGGGVIGILRNEPIYDVTNRKPMEFELIAKIIRNAERVGDYRQSGKYTVFWPTNEALTRVLGEERVKALQRIENQTQAQALLAGLTVKGNYNIASLQEAAKAKKALETLDGQPILLTKEGEKLFVNGVEVLGTEYPASNGWVLTTDGVIFKED